METEATAKTTPNLGPRDVDSDVEILRVARHDFKTPLTSLRMIAQMFQIAIEKGTFGEQSERTERNCQMMIDQVDKLVALSDIFSDIALLISGKLQLDRQHADLRAVVEAVVKQLGDRSAVIKSPDDSMWGQWDTARLQKALKYVFIQAPEVDLSLENKKGELIIRMKGNFKSASNKFADPARYYADAIIRQHGGRVTENHEIIFPAESSEQLAQ